MAARMISGRRRAVVALALLVLVLPILALTAGAGSPVGAPFPIRAEPEAEVNPAIAYNSQMQEYLVVFWNDRPGNDDIRAERVAADGRLLGGRWVAAGQGAERRYPDVTYNSQASNYLVVWVEESGGLSSVKAQRLWADGEALGTPISVFDGVLGQQTSSQPAVAYAFTADKYLVVWALEVFIPTPSPHTATSIVGRVINADGSTPDPEFVLSQDPGALPREQPDIAYNRHANGFLVVWQQWDSTYNLWDIHGRLVNGDGGTPFASFLVDNWMVDTTAPAVAAIPTAPGAYKYLVVWEKLGVGDRDIYARLIEENGTPAPGGFYVAADTTIDESVPVVSGDESGRRYLVAWRHPLGTVDVPIHGRAVSADGVLLYDVASFGGPLADCPAVAAGPHGMFLVAWQDRSVFATNTDIWGQLWGNRVSLPVTIGNR